MYRPVVIRHPQAGCFSHTLGDLIVEGACVPPVFDPIEGEFEVTLGSQPVLVSGKKKAKIPKSLSKLKNPAVQKALDFETLVYTNIYDHLGRAELNSYPGVLVKKGSLALDEVRCVLPDAGGIVICKSIMSAEYYADLIEQFEGDRPEIVHSNIPNASKIIKRFRSSTKRWIVSVGMITEGVDIPRSRVLIYIPYAKTELAFRQGIGRVIRSTGPNDTSRAKIILPNLSVFLEYARRVEDEMKQLNINPKSFIPKTKKCHDCHAPCALSATSCSECGFEFPQSRVEYENCATCNSSNVKGSTNCSSCGAQTQQPFVVDYKAAYREFVICRGMDVSNHDADEGVRLKSAMRSSVLATGDPAFIKIFRQIPDEMMSILQSHMQATTPKKKQSP